MKGLKTRSAILERAADLASGEGLEGLTIGRLADELQMSKSGLFAHFGSKEELQLATIEIARLRFFAEVFKPALEAERGYPRLVAICRSWLDYIARTAVAIHGFHSIGASSFRTANACAACTTRAPPGVDRDAGAARRRSAGF